MREIEKKDVTLKAAGSMPTVKLSNTGLVELTYRLVLRTSASRPGGLRGEVILDGDLGDNRPDECVVNFDDGSLARPTDLEGATLSVLASYAAPSDNSKQSVSLTVLISQDGIDVVNGRVTHEEQFTTLGGVIIRFRLKAA